MTTATLPLNGTKTHSLKPASLAVLRKLAVEPLRCHMVNPGVLDRLTRENLAIVQGQATLTGWVKNLVITDAGRAVMAQFDAVETALCVIAQGPVPSILVPPEILNQLKAQGLVTSACARGVVKITTAGRARIGSK